MFSYELSRNIDILLSEINKHDKLIECLNSMHELYTIQFRESFAGFLNKQADPSKFMRDCSAIRNNTVINILNKLKNNISPSLLYATLTDIKDVLILSNLPDNDILIDLLAKFSALLDKYLLNPDDINHNMELIYCGQDIYQVILNYKSFNKLLMSLMPLSKIESDEMELSIILYYTTAYDKFINKLESIRSIYLELCHLLNISDTEYPVKLVKIESGSLFSRILGNKIAINTLSSLIKTGAKYFYENYTNDGKISKIPRTVESIEAILGLSSLLKEQGIETTEIDEHIKKASVSIAKNLNKLLIGEPVIEIDGSIISLSGELEQSYIEESNQLYIEDKSD